MLQDRIYPDWKKTKPRTLLSTALVGEIGELCGIVTHLEGGGTNLKKYNRKQILHECADSYVMLVLLMASYDFSEDEFKKALSQLIKIELPARAHLREGRI